MYHEKENNGEIVTKGILRVAVSFMALFLGVFSFGGGCCWTEIPVFWPMMLSRLVGMLDCVWQCDLVLLNLAF